MAPMTWAAPAPWLGRLSHVAHVVEDLEAAMQRYTDTFGVRWGSVQERPGVFRYAGGEEREGCAKYSWTLDGPVHVELFEEMPGTVWQRAKGHPIHHLAYWVDDRDAEAERLQANGYTLEVTRAGPLAINGFGYFVGPDGLRVEPKPESTREAIDTWLGGTSLT
jgi:catechol 2,3-dioxygenase-like lactoylglutathione lyase family enzyme